jgi:hypothetical protein
MRAVVYLQLAGQQAVQQSAYAEGIGHVSMALELLRTLPDTVERLEQELAMQITLGPALMATKGFGASEVEEVFTRAHELCQEVGDTPQLYMVLQGRSGFYTLRVKFQTLRELMEQRLSLAQRLQNPAILAQAHLAQGHGCLAFGEMASARAHLTQGMALYNPEQHHSLAFGGGLDPSGRDHAALVLWLLGYPDQALERLHEVLTAVQKRPHPFSLAVALLFAAVLHQLRCGNARARATPLVGCWQRPTPGSPRDLTRWTLSKPRRCSLRYPDLLAQPGPGRTGAVERLRR